MDLLTPDLRAALVANAAAQRDAQSTGARDPDPPPVVKFFNPLGAATWLATELDPDGDTLFGLADLGFGCPELGSFSLSEIAGVRLPFGLGIERDLWFRPRFTLAAFAEAATRLDRITEDERELAAAARRLGLPDDPELPPDFAAVN